MMEQLEGQYFEKTISSLKQAKAGENITMRPEFKAELRAALENRIALQMGEPTGSTWAERILQFRYLLAGVPVLAVLMIAATNFSNWQVIIPNEQIVPVVNQQNNQNAYPNHNDVVALPSYSEISDTVGYPPIVTFSAASVMPPADILMKARQDQFSQTTQITYTQEYTNPTPVFGQTTPSVKLTNPSVTIYSYSTSTPVTTPTQAVQIPMQNSVAPNNQEPVYPVIGYGVTRPDKGNQLIDSNQSGRFEDHGQVQPNTIEQLPVMTQMQTPAANDSNAANAINQDAALKLIESGQTVPMVLNNQFSPMPVMKVESQPVIMNTTETNLAESMSLENASRIDTYIDSAEERLQPVVDPDLRVESSSVSMAMLPTYLNASRIYFQGEQRDSVVTALLQGLASKNGNLSSDYYITVKEIKNNKFKAVLYEFGQVREVLILGNRDGQLAVLTQIVY